MRFHHRETNTWDIDAQLAFLEENRAAFAEGIFATISDPRWYDPVSPSSLHDSWILKVDIAYAQAEHPREKSTRIRIDLLGAYHDRIITLDYIGVAESSLDIAVLRHCFEVSAHEFEQKEQLLTHRVRLRGSDFEVACRWLAITEAAIEPRAEDVTPQRG